MAKPGVRVLLDTSSGLEFDGSGAIDITDVVKSVSVRRGRVRLLNEFEAGTCTVTCFDSPTSPLQVIPLDQFQGGKIRIEVQPFSTTYPVYTGYISKFETKFAQNTDEISQISFSCIDAFRQLANANVTTVTGATAQLSGTRIEKILDQVSFPSTIQSLDAGLTTCQADPGTSRSALDAIKTVEKTEGGAFFIDRSGDARFLDRDTLYNKLYLSSPTVTTRFVDFPAVISIYRDVQYQNAVVRSDDELVYNDITVQRTGGTAQNKQDAASIALYFKRSASRTGLLMQTDTEASDLANVLLATLKDAETRIDQVTVDITDVDTAVASRAMNFELLDVCYAVKMLPSGTQLEVPRQVIQGIHWEFTPNRSTLNFYLAEPLLTGLILDDDYFGQLDYNYLGY